MHCTDNAYVTKDVARTSTRATLQSMGWRQLIFKSDKCAWVKKNIMTLACIDDLLIAGRSRDATSLLTQLRQSCSLKHATVLTSQQPLRFFKKMHPADIPTKTSQFSLERSYYNSMLKHTNLDDSSIPTSTPSLRRPPVQQDSNLDPDRHHAYRKVVGMLVWAAQVRPHLQFAAKDHIRHLASPAEWGVASSEAHSQIPQRNNALRVHHLTSTTSRTLNTSSASDISSRQHTLRQRLGQRHRAKEVYFRHSHLCTSGTSCTQQQDSEAQSTVASSARAELYAVGLGISDSLHIYQLLQGLQRHLQRPTCDFSNLNTQYNFATSAATTKLLTSSTLPIHILTDSTSASSLSSKLRFNKHSKQITFARPLCAGHPSHRPRQQPESDISRQSPDVYIKCIASPALERYLHHNGIIERYIEEGHINYFHVLELAAQHINDSEDDLEYTKEKDYVYNNRSNNFSTTGRGRKRTRTKTSRRNVKKQHNKPTSSMSSLWFYFNFKLLHIEHLRHNSHQQLWRHQRTRHKNSLTS